MTVRIAVPPQLDLEALARVEAELAQAPAGGAVQLDFAGVTECHAFVLARLLFGLARARPVELLNLTDRQRRLLRRDR